jgi:hypothetical protein
MPEMNQLTQKEEDALFALNLELDKLEAIPDGPTRWRASVELINRWNPHAQAEYDAVCREVKQERSRRNLSGNSVAANDSKTMRWGIRMPQTSFDFLSLMSGTIAAMSDGTPAERRQLVNKLMKTFPEWKIPERI